MVLIRKNAWCFRMPFFLHHSFSNKKVSLKAVLLDSALTAYIATAVIHRGRDVEILGCKEVATAVFSTVSLGKAQEW